MVVASDLRRYLKLRKNDCYRQLTEKLIFLQQNGSNVRYNHNMTQIHKLANMGVTSQSTEGEFKMNPCAALFTK